MELSASCDCAPDCAERIACEKAGEMGHFACGWCDTHGQARHICMCPFPPDQKEV